MKYYSPYYLLIVVNGWSEGSIPGGKLSPLTKVHMLFLYLKSTKNKSGTPWTQIYYMKTKENGSEKSMALAASKFKK